MFCAQELLQPSRPAQPVLRLLLFLVEMAALQPDDNRERSRSRSPPRFIQGVELPANLPSGKYQCRCRCNSWRHRVAGKKDNRFAPRCCQKVDHATMEYCGHLCETCFLFELESAPQITQREMLQRMQCKPETDEVTKRDPAGDQATKRDLADANAEKSAEFVKVEMKDESWTTELAMAAAKAEMKAKLEKPEPDEATKRDPAGDQAGKDGSGDGDSDMQRVLAGDMMLLDDDLHKAWEKVGTGDSATKRDLAGDQAGKDGDGDDAPISDSESTPSVYKGKTAGTRIPKDRRFVNVVGAPDDEGTG